MKKTILLFSLLFFSGTIAAQDYDDQEEYDTKTTGGHVHEIGFDGHFSASNFGGSGGLGVKYGYVLNENFIIGPSLRFQRSWYNNYGLKNAATIYGGGVWVHARFYNYFFIGAEFEMLNTPFDQVTYSGKRTWAPTLFAAAGFSREFGAGLRLNAGVYYDVINHGNSPFRTGYFLRNSKGVYIPLIYRIGLFIPIGRK